MNPVLRTFAAVLAAPFAAALAGCAGTGGAGSATGAMSAPVAEAPAIRVGDRWVYRGEDGFRVKTVWDETHEVTAIGADGITVRVTQKGPTLDVMRTELWAAPGLVKVGSVYETETRRFAVPLQRLDFPLAVGKIWNQRVDNFNEATRKSGNINRWGNVRRWEKVTTPAGTFDAVLMQVVMHLDDDDFWRTATSCNYAVWYAPEARAIVREHRDASYYEKGDEYPARIRTQYGTLELVSFTAGRP